MNRIALILGSGFSYNAGLPLAKDINFYLTRDNKRQLLHFSSDEWKWYDLASDTDKHNGSLSYDRIAYAYILNELVLDFIDKNNGFHNYEEFYQFVIDNLNERDYLKGISLRTHQKFDKNEEIKKDNSFYETYTNAFLNPQSKQVYNMINYLIGELLYWRKPFKEFSSSYDSFLSFISMYELKDIFTLNHDFLLEALFENCNIDYSDGFSIEGSSLQINKDKKIKCFNGSFNSTNLIKLHGSIDLYKYICAEENGSIINPTGEYIYFKTYDYYEKQSPVRVDVNTGEIMQKFHWNITPQFITGTNKEKLIESDEMYNALYKEMQNRIILADTLLIVGYSYMDEHVNEQIKLSLSHDKLKKIININPSLNFPYEARKETETINLGKIEELK